MRSATKKRMGRNPAYLAWIRTLPCVCCEQLLRSLRSEQCGPTEAAHVGERGLSQKSSDLETIPLCRWHHTQSPEAHHRIGKKFWAYWGIARDALIKSLNERFESEKESK